MLGGEFNKEKDITVDMIKTMWDKYTGNPIGKAVIFLFPGVTSFLFYLFFSNESGNLIAFTTLMIAVWFIIVSMWVLVWILRKDCGTEKMIEIADTIKEGSEGYFATQYTTIFKLALAFAGIILFLYLFRSPTANSLITEHVSSYLMAFFVSFSFLLGAFCSALAGYAGLWVSVRANIRVAAASRKCYDDAMKICFRGGAFAAIINVALALFGISA
jgi:Na+/H+-translocating membrane pyrophosphatase